MRISDWSSDVCSSDLLSTLPAALSACADVIPNCPANSEMMSLIIVTPVVVLMAPPACMKQAGSETELLAEVTQRLQLLRVLDQTLQRHVKTRNRRRLDLQWEWQHWNIRHRYRQWDAGDIEQRRQRQTQPSERTRFDPERWRIRSDERRVRKEGVRTCRPQWSQ